MAELFFELLAALLQGLFEVCLEVFAEEIVAFLSRAVFEVFSDSEETNPILAIVGYLTLGAVTGGLSLLLISHRLVRTSRFHGISLFLSPLVTGSIMSLVGRRLRRRGKQAAQIETFAYGFAFALGMATIRFLFAK
jgi:hypothetical protein